MGKIYEEEGPRWYDSEGELNIGWPRDGYCHLLIQNGDTYTRFSQSRHIDGDETNETTISMTEDEAAQWLARRDLDEAFTTLVLYFPKHVERAEVVFEHPEGKETTQIRVMLGDLWFTERAGRRTRLSKKAARKRLLREGCPPETVREHFP